MLSAEPPVARVLLLIAIAIVIATTIFMPRDSFVVLAIFQTRSTRQFVGRWIPVIVIRTVTDGARFASKPSLAV